jgi:hypothetical protein
MRETASLEKSIGTTTKPKENTSNYQCCVLAIFNPNHHPGELHTSVVRLYMVFSFRI